MAKQCIIKPKAMHIQTLIGAEHNVGVCVAEFSAGQLEALRIENSKVLPVQLCLLVS